MCLQKRLWIGYGLVVDIEGEMDYNSLRNLTLNYLGLQKTYKPITPMK